MKYRGGCCKNCGRARIYETGVCEKCWWDNDASEYATVTRPDEFYENQYYGPEDAALMRQAEEDYDASWARAFAPK